MKKLLTIFIAFVLFTFLSTRINAQIRIDGVFFDWTPQTQLDVPPNNVELTFAQGDPDAPDPNNPSYFADLDIDDVYATDDADFVYFRVKLNSIANVLNIPNDTSYHGGAAIAVYISVDPGASDTTGLTWGWWGNGYDFFIQVYPGDSVAVANTLYDQFIWEHTQTGNGWDFIPADTLIGVKVAWNAENNDVEFAVPKLKLFNPHFMPNFTIPQNIAVMVYAGENNSPWRADYASNAGVAGYLVQMKNPGPISVDGLFFDWDSGMQLDVAPNVDELTFAQGDPDAPDPNNPSYFADLDIEDVYANSGEDFVYLRIKMNSIANVLNIPNDTSYHGGAAIAAYISVDPGASDTTGLTWGWWGSGYDFFVQVYPPDSAMQVNTGYPQALWEHKQTGNGWDFELADLLRGCWVAWNVDNNDVEVAVPRVLLFNPRYLPNFQIPDTIAVMIYAGENNAPWRADYASNSGVAGYPINVVVTGIDDPLDNSLPKEFKLSQNYPNPFNPSTTINYSLPVAGFVTLKVYNLLGEEVAVLVNEDKSAGNHTTIFNAAGLPSGIYLYSLSTGFNKETRKMILLK
ncbi:T9SS type A sorting domain-containing protein [Ignavibacterium album]|uniref:T9SS type A sorting domain-containing protein n=1 Tax=Ignavibacterium album TaxID=591197 RepID=UPI0035B7558E